MLQDEIRMGAIGVGSQEFTIEGKGGDCHIPIEYD